MRPSQGCEIVLNSRECSRLLPGHVDYSPLYALALPAPVWFQTRGGKKESNKFVAMKLPLGGWHNDAWDGMPLLQAVLVWVHPCSQLNKVRRQPITSSVWVASAPCSGLLPGPGKSGAQGAPMTISRHPYVNGQVESRGTAGCPIFPMKCI